LKNDSRAHPVCYGLNIVTPLYYILYHYIYGLHLAAVQGFFFFLTNIQSTNI